jgi:Putative Actinobacterial Holin-X, holin superfamily III
LPASNGKPDNIVQTVTEISDRMSNLVRDEIELAKAEVTKKAMSLLRGTVAVIAGAVFGVFAIVIGLEAAAWGVDAALVQGAGNIWEGFLIVFGALAILAVLSFVFAFSKLKAGAPPTPTMAIDEAKRIREAVAKPELAAGTREVVAAKAEGVAEAER